ncbi:hypothetical protein LQZ18_01995 [Lachnospiraceae bacterium ZAX-1]
MKKIISMLMACIILATMLGGCGKSLQAEEDTVFVKKKGGIVSAIIETLDKEYYDATELETYVKERVDDYNANHEKDSVEVDKFSVEGDTATLYMKFAGYQDYAEFSEVEFFAGLVSQALVAGYKFDTEFIAIENGVAAGSVKMEDVTGNSEYKVAIVSEKINVKVDGEVIFMSKDNTSLVAKDTVAIQSPDADSSEQPLTYVIYK